MGATYTRQSTFTDGDVIDSDLFNNEYDQLLAAFASSTGHTHDGTAGEGGPVTALVTDGVVFGTNTGDITLTWNAGTNDGLITWKEDEDYFEFNDDIRIATTEKLQFRDTAIYINSSVDGQLDIVADTEIQIAATTVDINGLVDVSGNLTVGGNLTVTGAATIAGNLTFGDAASDTVAFTADVASHLLPSADATYNLGASGSEWNDLFIDGTANIDSLVADTADINGGTIDGAVIGGASAAAITGTTITGTSFVIGSAAITEAELEILDGATITTAELNILDGVTSTAAELNILDGVTSTTAELNILDGVTSTAAELNILDGVTSTAAELNILDGVTSTAAELNILDGVTSTAAELNTLDGVTAVVGEINALDIGSTAIGTAVASKAVILDANKDYAGVRNLTISGELDAATLDISGDADIDGTLEADAITIAGVTLAETIADTVGAMVTSNTESGITVAYDDADNTLDFTVGTLNQNTSGTAAIATTVTITDNEATNENNAIIFTAGGDLDGGNLGLESDGTLYYNPSTGTLTTTNISVTGTLSTVDSVTMSANNAVIFEGATADAHETTLTIVDATADRTITLPNVSGTVPVLAAASNTQVTSTPEELNILDGVTSTAAELNILDGKLFLDEDNLASDSATGIASQQSIKAYVDGATGGSITSVGALNSGSVTSGFGNIDTGASTITTTGLISGGSLDIDNVLINGVTIGHTDDTDLITLAAGIATVAGEISVTTLDIGGTNVTSTAAELNILDGVTSTAAELNILDVDNTTLGDLTEISTVASEDTFIAIDASGGGLKKITRATIVAGLATDSVLANMVDDTSPQLGGNLDTNSQNILIDDAHFIGDESGNEQIVFKTTGSAVNYLEITNNASGSNPILAAAGGDTNIGIALTPKGTGEIVIAAGNLNYAGTAITSTGAELNILDGVTSTAAELNILDGATVVVGEINALDLGSTAVGNAIASKAVILDSNKDYTGMRNLTVSGELDAATGDFSGNVDIDGTLETDALSLNGTAVTSTAAELNILDGVTSTAAELNILDGVTTTAAELNILDGVTSTTAELNALDGITAVVAELNALDIGTTAVGTAVASKAVILDSNKDYTGIRNLTISGELDAATLDVSGNVDIDGTLETDALSINSTAVTSTAAELNALDGITAVVGELNALDIGSTAVGTAVASKAVILDSSKDYTGMRNFTITGNLVVGGTTTVVDTVTMNAQNAVIFEGATADDHETTLTIIDPTADRTINLPNQSGTIPVLAAASNTAITSTPAELNILDGVTSTAAELNILDGVTSTAAELNILDGVTSTAAELNILDGVTSTAAELNIMDGVTTTAAEINLIDGGTARGTTAVADGDGILINDGGTMRMTTVQTVSAYMAAESVGGAAMVTTGALNAGSITSGFGTINNGSSTITTSGTVATGAITAGGNLTRGGTVILDGSITDTGDFTIDVAGDLILDAAGDDILLKSAGTHEGNINFASSNLTFKSIVSDKDMIFQGNDGGSAITALTLDMSAAGAATFNNDVTAFSDERLKSNITTIPDALSKVTEMRGVHYVRNETGKDSTGVIAQELQKIAPELVLTAEDEMGTLSVNYGNITGYLIEAVKELSARVKELEGK